MIARLWHEKHVSQLFSPLLLGMLAFSLKAFQMTSLPWSCQVLRSIRQCSLDNIACRVLRLRHLTIVDALPQIKKCKGKIDEATRNRWLQDNRQFAPWHYQEPSMLQDEQQQLILPSIEVKEQMHYLPPGYTGATGAPAIARHTMLGNSWHLGVAKLLLWFLLQWAPTTSILVTPKMSSLQWVLSVSNRSPPTLGPGFWPQEVFEMPPADTMEHHWTLAQQCQHPALSDRALEPGLLQTLHALLTTWSDIPRLRREVVAEIAEVVESFADQTRTWWNELHPHVKHVYDHQEDFFHYSGSCFAATSEMVSISRSFTLSGRFEFGI